VEFDDSKYEGYAALVRDEHLAKTISKIKYSDPERAKEHRIVLEIILIKVLIRCSPTRPYYF